MKSGQWTQEEHTAFLKGLIKYNSASQKWKLIAKEFVTTRTRTQTASHSQKYWKRLRIGLKSLSKPKKNKHCVQCSECEKWFTGRYWTEEEVWALKDWWMCDTCDETANPQKEGAKARASSEGKKKKKKATKKRKASEMTDSDTGSESDTDTNEEENALRKLAEASLAVQVSRGMAPVRCICSSAHVESEMVECLKCHNHLHQECVKDELESGTTTTTSAAGYECFFCLNPDKVASSPTASIDSTDAVKSLPLKKRRLGY